MKDMVRIFFCFMIVVLSAGCGKRAEASASLSTAPVNYQAPRPVAESREDIIASIEAGVLLTDKQAAALAEQNMEEYGDIAAELLLLINGYREENGLAALEQDDTLDRIAMHRAAENAHMEWMETVTDSEGTHHLRPDGQMVSSIFITYAKYGEYGEILGRRQESAAEVFEDWRLSAEHNACMLADKFRYIGVGVAKADNGDVYFAVEFMD